MDRILTDKEINQLETFLYSVPDYIIDKLTLNELYELMLKNKNERKGA